MTLAEAADLINEQFAGVNEVWNFFITIHLAILGAFLLIRRRINFVEQLVVIGAYLGFMYMNFTAVTNAYDIRIVLIEMAGAIPVEPGAPEEALRDYYAARDLRSEISYVPIVYGVAAAVTVFAILFINLFALISEGKDD